MPEPIESTDPVPFEEAQRMAAEHNAKAMQVINDPGWKPGEWREIARKESEAYWARLDEKLSMGKQAIQQEKEPASQDPYGIVSVFAAHLCLSLESMSPPEAFEAAQHATRHHLRSYEFLTLSHKGSQDVEYRMVRKRSSSSTRSATEDIKTKPMRGGDAIEHAR